MPLPEQTRLELEAIDAALAGQPVDPRLADLTELALLLADSRPEPSPARAAALDRRFAALATPSPRRVTAPGRRPWFLRPAFATSLAVVLILAVLVVVLPHGGRSSSNFSSHSSAGPAASAGDSSASAGSSASSSSSASSASSPGSLAPTTVPTPQPNGRRIVQTSQLSLSTPSARLGAVSQELFDAVAAEQGIVKHSTVSTGTDGEASFTLSIPTPNLSAALARLTRLRYATVSSSTASTTDVNSQYLDDQRRLADARALRQALLKQLQAAATATAVDSLKTQIRDAESAITRDETTVANLQSRISDSGVDVQISTTDMPASRSPGGFTIHRAAHDALDVLKVAAGVALIVLAVLVPLGLAAALVARVNFGWRRRRRERTLDAT